MRATRESGDLGSGEQEQESFARAVDSGMFDSSDPTLRRELDIVSALRDVGAEFETRVGPSAAERDRMRQRVMVEFSTVVHGGSSPVLALRPSRPRPRIPGDTRGRLLVAAAAALCLLMSLSGMSLLLSRDALPGNALYVFKRTAESAELGLTFGDQPKALKHLEFASARVSEIEMMAGQADGAGNWSAGQDDFRRVLDDFDSDTTAGTRLLTALATHGQTTVLSGLRGWAEQQENRLSTVRSALPLPTSTRLDRTLGLLDRVVVRTSALGNRSECTTITSGTRDDLGLRPAKDSCKTAPVDGASSTIPLPDAPPSPAATPPSDEVPPGLVGSPSGSPGTSGGQPEQKRPGLSPTPRTEGVLPAPRRPDSEPWRKLPQDGSPWPTVPLPLLGIPVPVVLPPPA